MMADAVERHLGDAVDAWPQRDGHCVPADVQIGPEVAEAGAPPVVRVSVPLVECQAVDLDAGLDETDMHHVDDAAKVLRRHVEGGRQRHEAVRRARRR